MDASSVTPQAQALLVEWDFLSSNYGDQVVSMIKTNSTLLADKSRGELLAARQVQPVRSTLNEICDLAFLSRELQTVGYRDQDAMSVVYQARFHEMINMQPSPCAAAFELQRQTTETWRREVMTAWKAAHEGQ